MSSLSLSLTQHVTIQSKEHALQRFAWPMATAITHTSPSRVKHFHLQETRMQTGNTRTQDHVADGWSGMCRKMVDMWHLSLGNLKQLSQKGHSKYGNNLIGGLPGSWEARKALFFHAAGQQSLAACGLEHWPCSWGTRPVAATTRPVAATATAAKAVSASPIPKQRALPLRQPRESHGHGQPNLARRSAWNKGLAILLFQQWAAVLLHHSRGVGKMAPRASAILLQWLAAQVPKFRLGRLHSK